MSKKRKSKQDVKPIADKDRQAALKSALDRIEKDFGKGAVLTLGDTASMSKKENQNKMSSRLPIKTDRRH
jgi:RecA/RadA recombinase